MPNNKALPRTMLGWVAVAERGIWPESFAEHRSSIISQYASGSISLHGVAFKIVRAELRLVRRASKAKSAPSGKRSTRKAKS